MNCGRRENSEEKEYVTKNALQSTDEHNKHVQSTQKQLITDYNFS